MGSGKTTATIKYINSLPRGRPVIFCTPYLGEVERVLENCGGFVQPDAEVGGSKSRHLKRLLAKGANVATTHSLFSLSDEETKELFRRNRYMLIIDEAIEPLAEVGLGEFDQNVLIGNYLDCGEHVVQWKVDDYKGVFDNVRRMCEKKQLYCLNGRLYEGLAADLFDCFADVMVLTYLFEGSLLAAYFKLCGLEYEFWHVCDFELVAGRKVDGGKQFAELVHVVHDDKLNACGAGGVNNSVLSHTWYKNHGDDKDVMRRMRSNIGNFFRNMCRAKSSEVLWTTYKDYRHVLKGKGYTKGFEVMNVKATNVHMHKPYVAYMVNRYINPVIKNDLAACGVKFDDDMYSLADMLQFVWRSRIRQGQDIILYVPSARMRGLFEQWLEQEGV